MNYRHLLLAAAVAVAGGSIAVVATNTANKAEEKSASERGMKKGKTGEKHEGKTPRRQSATPAKK